MKIKVTEDDIKYGKRKSSSRCPIALALIRKFPNFKATVHTNCIAVWSDKVCVRRVFPVHVFDFINDFDNEKPVNAMEFEINKYITYPLDEGCLKDLGYEN